MSIRIERVVKRYDLPGRQQLNVLENITFTIERGDFVIILGESGCGKSTLLNLIAGLLPVSSGEISVNGTKVTGPHPSRAILFQQPSLLPWLTVEENIVFGCKLRGDTENLKFRARLLIDIMGLSGFENSRPSELSLGMAQRVCLARAFIGHPEILLLDEPFSSLDTVNRTHLQQELIDFWQIEQFTVVFVTHDIDEAILLGNKIVLLGCRPCEVMEIFEVELNYPRNPGSRNFFQIRNKIISRFKETFIDCKLG